MLYAIVADTHDHVSHVEKLKDYMRENGIETVIHLGDFCAGPTVRAFDGVKLIGILGNNDGDALRIEKNFEQIDGDFRWSFCVLDLDGLQTACYHGTEPPITNALIDCGTYDVVLCGHTHAVINTTRGNTLVINPGTLHGFGKEATFAVLDTETKEVEIVTL